MFRVTESDASFPLYREEQPYRGCDHDGGDYLAEIPALDVADVLRNVQMSFDQKDAAYRALVEEGYRATAFLETLPDMSENTKEAISEIYLRD